MWRSFHRAKHAGFRALSRETDYLRTLENTIEVALASAKENQCRDLLRVALDAGEKVGCDSVIAAAIAVYLGASNLPDDNEAQVLVTSQSEPVKDLFALQNDEVSLKKQNARALAATISDKYIYDDTDNETADSDLFRNVTDTFEVSHTAANFASEGSSNLKKPVCTEIQKSDSLDGVETAAALVQNRAADCKSASFSRPAFPAFVAAKPLIVVPPTGLLIFVSTTIISVIAKTCIICD